jgi:hypothetical protein
MGLHCDSCKVFLEFIRRSVQSVAATGMQTYVSIEKGLNAKLHLFEVDFLGIADCYDMREETFTCFGG